MTKNYKKMSEIEEGDIPVDIHCNLTALRFMHKALSDAYRSWPGGHPDDQVQLEIIRNGLYAILMETLLENDLV